MNHNNRPRLNLETVRERLSVKSGQEYWRSLEELAETEEFQEFLQDEFPNQTRSLLGEMDRRQFLLLGAASLALAGMSGCRYLPDKKAVPYVIPPEEWIPGRPLFYATAFTLQGFAQGALVRSNDGRPTKVEGSPEHPATLGASDAIMQAAILSLYDPDRSQSVTYDGELSSWDLFLDAARTALAKQKPSKGAGLHFLTETTTSQTLKSQMEAIQTLYPQAKWHQYEPVGRDSVRAGAKLAFGTDIHTVYHFDKAERILSLDADFLLSQPGHVRYAKDFSDRRRVRKDTKEINRLYALESAPTITGAAADHRHPVKASEVEPITFAIAKALGVDTGSNAGDAAKLPWLEALVKDLKANQGKCLVVPGDYASPAVHALAHAMNAQLGSVGTTVTYTDALEINPTDQIASLKELIQAMQGGQVETLVMLGGNPVYNAPADLNFGDNLSKVPLRIHLSQHNDETSERCNWHVPESHFLETWGDAAAYDGTVSLIQPLIAPLHNTHSAIELLEALQNKARTGYEIVHEYFTAQSGKTADEFEKPWQQIVHDGMLPNSAAATKTVALKAGLGGSLTSTPANVQGLEIIFRPDPTIWDGRFANNGWLQELPKPLVKITWDNAALMSPATAMKNGLTNEDIIELTVKDRKVNAPVWMVPGHPDDCVTVYLGYGRKRCGIVGREAGFNAYLLRSSDAPWFASGLAISKPQGRYELATTQHHHSMEDRAPVQSTTLEEFIKTPNFIEEYYKKKEGTIEGEPKAEGGEKKHEPLTLYGTNDHAYPKDPKDQDDSFGAYQWGMSVDVNACIGCNACVTGCQSENNIPIVGRDQILRGREMHWIRIDRYYKFKPKDKPEVADLPDNDPGRNKVDVAFDPSSIETYFQPVMCMHCEDAPCEPVCPVAATIHSHEGLNMMVYNRCIGTKYCSNNCPYKVRRFNFYKYVAAQPDPPKLNGNYDSPLIKLSANPDVTVRGRGVMEKCTYCVQRINVARIEAKKEGREIKEGEVKTACQQACPTSAISFGNIRDAKAEVSLQKAEPHSYSLLEELNTKPRTTYLAKFRNPNPEIVKS